MMRWMLKNIVTLLTTFQALCNHLHQVKNVRRAVSNFTPSALLSENSKHICAMHHYNLSTLAPASSA